MTTNVMTPLEYVRATCENAEREGSPVVAFRIDTVRALLAMLEHDTPDVESQRSIPEADFSVRSVAVKSPAKH